MEFERREKWLVSGFREEQMMETGLTTIPGDEYYVQMEGDTIIDDGWMDYSLFSIGLNVEEARKLYDELGHWLNGHDGDS
jgi:hypothetical protein